MREVKFRAWDFTQQAMYGVEEMILENNKVSWVHEANKDGYCLTPTKVGNASIEIMQFTGMHDSEGNDIYEGDIVQIPDDWDTYGMNCGEIYEVYFAYGGFRLKPKYTRGKGYYVEEDNVLIHLGNIYENPELLEAKDGD